MGRASRRKKAREERGARTGPSPKVSACLIDVMGPYLEECESGEAYRKLVALASAAWNLALLSPEERQGNTDRLLQSLPDEDRALVEVMLQQLIARKEELFPHDRRFVVNADVLEEGDHFRVVAGSLGGK
jgi:hypothetical protein